MSERRVVGEGRLVHRTDWIAVTDYTVERGGRTATYSVVERADSIIVAPVTPAGRTVVLKQFRLPTNETAWELPMGSVDDGESPESAAERELREEVGMSAAELIRIAEYRPAPGLTPQRTTIFVARVSDEQLDAAIARWSASEDIEQAAAVSLGELPRMAADGRISDGFSLAGVLFVGLWLGAQA